MVEAEEEHKKTCCEKLADGFRSFNHFLYDKEKGEVLGRNGKSWAKIGFFYLIFYGFLAGFFSGLLAIFLTTINTPEEGGPKLTQYIVNQPGLTRLDKKKGDRLYFNYDKNPEENEIVEAYVKLVNGFLEKFDNGWNTTGVTCAADDDVVEEGELPCKFDRELLGNCSGIDDPSYGLKKGMPCIFLKINKIYNWIPVPTNGSGYIKLNCDKGVVSPPGFYLGGFPFRGQKNYELPFVSVQFDKANVKQVDCVLEAENIKVSKSFNPSRSYGKIRIKDEKL